MLSLHFALRLSVLLIGMIPGVSSSFVTQLVPAAPVMIIDDFLDEQTIDRIVRQIPTPDGATTGEAILDPWRWSNDGLIAGGGHRGTQARAIVKASGGIECRIKNAVSQAGYGSFMDEPFASHECQDCGLPTPGQPSAQPFLFSMMYSGGTGIVSLVLLMCVLMRLAPGPPGAHRQASSRALKAAPRAR